MEDLIGLLLFVIVIAASAIGNVAERRKRSREQEAMKALRSAGGGTPRPAPAKTWQAPSDEVRRFLENLEQRLSGGEAPEAPAQAPRPARSLPGAPPVLSPRTLRPPVSSAPPARMPAAPPQRAPAQVRQPARIQPRRPLKPGPPGPRIVAPTPAPAAEAPPTTVRVAPSEMPREPASAPDTAFSAADYAFTTTAFDVPDLARAILEDRDSLRRAVIAREILGPPRSMTI